MPNPSLPLDNARQLLALLQSKQVSAVDVANASLARIEATNSQLNAYVTVAAETALAAARQIDERRARGDSLGMLAGLPIAVKDLVCTQGLRTTCGSRMLSTFVPPYDATITRKLKAADAVIVGKTNMDEFAMGGSTETSVWGAGHNPWDLQRTQGGSSGGAAACVAAQTVPLSIGSDTGGSIRQPASFCGITGLKPTYGRISRYGLVAFASSLDQLGPMTWDVGDLALLLQVIAGFDPLDSTSIDAPVPDYLACLDQPMRGKKIGVVHRDQLADLDPAVAKAVHEAMEVYRQAGAELIDIDLPHAKYWVPTYYLIAPSEASSNLSRYAGAHYGHRDEVSAKEAGGRGPLVATYCRSRDHGFGAEVKRRIMIGTYALSAGYKDAYYVKALQVRRLIRNDFDAAFKKVDLLLGPTTPTPAFKLGEKLSDPIQMYLGDLFTVGANLAGLPALSIPGGISAQGLPVGIQLQAPPLAEERLLAAGAAFQRATQWHTRRPAA